MPRIILKSTVLAAFTFSAIGMYVGAQSVPEAPAGFDNQTNGNMTQSDMDTAAGVFSEIDTPKKGLGPMYNGVSCAECHQNMAMGGGAQAQVLRAGYSARGEHSGDNYFHDFRRRRDTNGSSSSQLTIGGEMNKFAANIAMGRNHAAVHWRYDYADWVVLGESVATAMLKDMAHCWNEPFAGFSFTKFDGTRVTGIGKNT